MNLLLAQINEVDPQTVFETWRNAFRPDHAARDAFLLLAKLAGVVVAVYLLHRFVFRTEARERRKPDYLRQFARRLGLTRTQIADLRSLARVAGLSNPGALLLAPGVLADALRRVAPPDAELRRRIEALSRELFGEPAPAPAPTASEPS